MATGASLDVGGVISRSFGIWMKNIIPFGALALIVQSPFLLFGLLAPISGQTSFYVYTSVITVGTSIAGVVTGAAVAYGVFQQMRGQTVTLGQCISVGLSRLLPVIGTGILVGLLVGVGTLLFVIPGIVIACIFYVAVPAAVVERAGPRTAMDRSAFLTKGNRWQVFAVALVLGIIVVLAGWLLGKVIGPGSPDVTDMAKFWAGIRMQQVVGLLIGAILGSLSSVASVVVYHDLRAQKESIDLEKIAAVFG